MHLAIALRTLLVLHCEDAALETLKDQLITELQLRGTTPASASLQKSCTTSQDCLCLRSTRCSAQGQCELELEFNFPQYTHRKVWLSSPAVPCPPRVQDCLPIMLAGQPRIRAAVDKLLPRMTLAAAPSLLRPPRPVSNTPSPSMQAILPDLPGTRFGVPTGAQSLPAPPPSLVAPRAPRPSHSAWWVGFAPLTALGMLFAAAFGLGIFWVHRRSRTAAIGTQMRPLRQILEERLLTDQDLEAFCIDYFPGIAKEFSTGMPRTQKLNVLLTRAESQAIREALADAFPNKSSAMDRAQTAL